MALVFGIDLGIASCGWAVLRLPEGETPGEVVALGSWMFDKPETAKDKTPTNQLRRSARLLRRVIRRRRSRMGALRRLFQQHELIVSAEADLLKRKGLDPWELRAKGLDRALTPAELAVALGHIAKRRGFQSNKKNKAGTNEAGDDGKMLKALSATRERTARYRTIGEMFARDPDYAGRKRNRDGLFDRTLSREDQRSEVTALFAAQRRLGNASASEELEGAFVGEAFFQRSLQDSEKLVGPCPFEPGEKRAAKASPSFELFRLLQRLVHLRVTSADGERQLTPAELAAATADLGATATLTGTRVRKLIGLPPEYRFTTITAEQEKGDIATRTGAALMGTAKLREVLGEAEWTALHRTPERLDAIAHVLTFFETNETIGRELGRLGLPDQAIAALLAGLEANAFARFNGAGHISAKAARRLIPHLLAGKRYDQACEAAGYDHAATRWSKDPQVTDKAGFNDLVKELGGAIANPVARKAMTEGLKQLWAMRNEWGLPDAIHIELARDVGNSLEKRQEIQRGLDKATAERQRDRLCELLGVDHVSGDTLLRYRLWQEQGSRCLYTDTYIDPRQLVATDNSVQVDHILPWSRFGDDSFANKTLCLAGANQRKRGATPFEWFARDGLDWDGFVERVERAKEMKGFKKRNYLLKNAAEAAEKFRSRNLNDTRYAARTLAEAARLFFPAGERQDKGGVRRVFTRPGGLTAALRQAWGVESLKKADGKRVEDARHHALDAAVVAAVSESQVQALTESYKQWEQQGLGRPLRQVDEPWDGFRQELKAAYHDKSRLFVARAERRRARGEGHAATIRQVAEREGTELVFERKAVLDLKAADLDRIKDPERNAAIIASLRGWIDRGKPVADLPRSHTGAEIRKVHLLAKGRPAVRVRGGTAERGEMVRVDVFTKANKRGKDEFYLVPIYPHQVMDQRDWPTPPMRAIAAFKDENEWFEMDESYRFRFSLFSRSFVEAEKPDGELIGGYFQGVHRGTGNISVFRHQKSRRRMGWYRPQTSHSLQEVCRRPFRPPVGGEGGSAHMAWRGLHIAEPARLSQRAAQLVVERDGDGDGAGDTLTFPIEDLAWIILDTPRTSLTGALLGALAEGGVALIVPDARHHPAGMLLSFHQHYAQSAVAHAQIGASGPLKKRLWQKLVVAKIENQAAVLRALGEEEARALSAMAGRVASGDPDNLEAQAARAYWPLLFAADFRRHGDCRRNALLNYGYAVVRAALARACAAAGLLPAFGLHHHSRLNAFNLVDDLIEPFRPSVDRMARARATEAEGDILSVEDRRYMAAILTESVSVGEERQTVLAATEAVAASLVRAIDAGQAGPLVVPALPLARR